MYNKRIKKRTDVIRPQETLDDVNAIVKPDKKRINVIRRQATLDDVDGILKLDNEVWPDFPATREMIRSRIEVFPEGNFVGVCNGEVVGHTSLQIVRYDLEKHPPFTWMEITDGGTWRKSHRLDGNHVYGVSLSVSPKVRNYGVGSQMLFCGWSLIIRYNKDICLLGSRIPNYHQYKDKYSPEEYIKLRREDGKLVDPELRLYEHDGFKIICVLPEYENDPESCNYGVLVAQNNPFYNRGWQGFRNFMAWLIFNYGHKVIGV